jgi:hypothetical protein
VSNYLTIVNDIKGKLETVPDIGAVHGYSRRTNTEKGFTDLFTIVTSQGKKKLIGWEITRSSALETKRGNTFFRHHRMKAAGYMAIEDKLATDQLFQVLLDMIGDTFRTAEAAAGDAAPWYYMDGLNPGKSCVQTEVVDERMFGDYLCHHADVYITITERIVA